MVKTVPRYDPPTEIDLNPHGMVWFDVRLMDRRGNILIDFGSFRDLLSYNDSLSVENPAGNWTLKMRAWLHNEELLRKVHPGMIIEVYCAWNADPLLEVAPFVPEKKPEDVFLTTVPESGGDKDKSGDSAAGDTSTGSLLDADFAPVDGNPAPPPEPEPADYLDLAPYLLMRGITTNYGRSSAIIEGAGAETTLTLSGASYGKIYQDAMVLTDTRSPTALGKSLEVRYNTQTVNTVVPLYYGILRHWVEQFWNEDTGWEARTRPIPVPPDIMARNTSEGSAWSALQYLSVSGLFHMFVDHTGAICWEKLPYSSKCDTLIDQFMKDKVGVKNLRNWEDLPLIECPSFLIQAWSDRLSADGVSNYLRVQMTQYGGSGGNQSNMDAGQIYNQGSIRQYGGPKKMEILLPAGTAPTFPYEDVERQEAEERLRTFMDLLCLECIRWYDRPTQRVILQLRGDAVWRINTRVSVTEDWHNPEAKPGEYYVVSRSHNINLSNGAWTTQVECTRDRRKRYLGVGLEPVEKDKFGTAEDQLELPTEPDEYWFYDRNDGNINKIDWPRFVEPYYPEDRDKCKRKLLEGDRESPTDTKAQNEADAQQGWAG